MLKRPKRGETEEDILRMQQEFMSEKAKNPKMQPAAQMVKISPAPRKSLFARSREKSVKPNRDAPMVGSIDISPSMRKEKTVEILGEIHEKTKLDINSMSEQSQITDVMLGDIVEKQFATPKPPNCSISMDTSSFPEVDSTPINVIPTKGKSIFALSMEAKKNAMTQIHEQSDPEPMQYEDSEEKRDLSCIFGETSVIVEDASIAAAVHKENMQLLSQMKEKQILEERKKLLDTIDESLVALLSKLRQTKAASIPESQNSGQHKEVDTKKPIDSNLVHDADEASVLLPSNPATEIIKRSNAENWIHFDVVEKDKLAWMKDIPMQVTKLMHGEKFEARFDWKGVLLPYSTQNTMQSNLGINSAEKDERELYLHGEEPHRPGYTLQELFRLARSNIIQQRVSAFSAIAGMLNIYNQGFYDQVLDLPISKIFFLLRFGFDDNTPAMLEVVAKALSFLCYNETDETLLDFIYDNPSCYWQPTLEVMQSNLDANDDDPTSIENLQRQMQQLRVNVTATKAATSIKANVEESEEESKTSMSDFQLAEMDLIDCMLRTNILQRIYFILHNVRPDNSTVSSCLKLLIRLARTSKEIATQIVNKSDLISCLLQDFLPGLEQVDTMLQTPPFYNYPQYLCLKLMRVLMSQSLSIAVKLVNSGLIQIVQNYLCHRENIKNELIKVQIESLRTLRCLLLLRIDYTLYKKFLPVFRYMLEWHFNHIDYEVGGSALLRQHAAALLAAITSSPGGLEAGALLGDMLHDCCCSWFHRATRTVGGVKEFSQATLLSSCLNAAAWHMQHCDAERFRNFNDKYLKDFVYSDNFLGLLEALASSSILLRKVSGDRRSMHPPLPNVGAVLLHEHGPQLVVPQSYGAHLLVALWRLLELELQRGKKTLFEALLQPRNVEPLMRYLSALGTGMHRYLATNFFAKTELKFIFKLLCFEGTRAYFDKAQMLQLVYNFLCCLTAEHINEIEQLFERVIFNASYLDVDAETLQRWRNTCLELVYQHSIVVSPNDLSLSLPATQVPVLPRDWPYFQLKIILQDYIDNVQQAITQKFSEREILCMTFTFVSQLEQCNPQLQITTPTEQLMYLMIAFMGRNSEFLTPEVQSLLKVNLLQFYAQCQEHTFQFDAAYEGKCKFENLYALFVDHFQAASYGNELFSSLMLVPLAQKYDNKWRRRVWSDYVAALRFLDCDESLLLGGLKSYLEPAEEEESLIKAYASALNMNLVRPNTIPYKIAEYHVEKYKNKQKK